VEWRKRGPKPRHGCPTQGQVGGTGTTYPVYKPAAFFLADVGIIELDEPWVLSDPND